jgi:SulP family sulfate permease
MTDLNRIVVALACTDADRPLIAYAALLARLGGAREVRFVHVGDPSVPVAEARDRMCSLVGEAFGGSAATIVCDVRHGSITDQLLAYVTEFRADLILIGSKKHKLGARLAMVGPCSLGVVPNDYPATLTHLMVAIDFSNAADDVLEWATSIAAGDRSIRCTALHVMTHESADLFASNEGESEQAETMRQILSQADRHKVPVETRLASAARTSEVSRNRPFFLPASIQGADVAHAILAEAAACGADCIALSTRGRSRSASILLGSVTEKVIERATVPLLVGKHGGKNLGLAEILLGRAGWSADIKTN